MTTTPKPKTPRFYIPQHVREVVNDVAGKSGLTPGEFVEGSVFHLLNEHARTGQPPGASLRAMVERAKARAGQVTEQPAMGNVNGTTGPSLPAIHGARRWHRVPSVPRPFQTPGNRGFEDRPGQRGVANGQGFSLANGLGLCAAGEPVCGRVPSAPLPPSRNGGLSMDPDRRPN